MKLIKKNKWIIISLAIVFCFTLFFPYSGDDLQWYTVKVSADMFSKLAHSVNLNGRYAGNFFVILMTKNIFIRGIIMSIVLVAINMLVKRETKSNSIIVWLMLILMPLPIFQQSVVWTSGFTNYVISCLFLLISLLLIRNCFNNNDKKYNIITNFLVLFIASLFIENLTVFMIIFVMAMNILYFIKKKKISFSLISSFLGTTVGTIVMFSHPVYHKVIDGTDSYRAYSRGGVLGASYPWLKKTFLMLFPIIQY